MAAIKIPMLDTKLADLRTEMEELKERLEHMELLEEVIDDIIADEGSNLAELRRNCIDAAFERITEELFGTGIEMEFDTQCEIAEAIREESEAY